MKKLIGTLGLLLALLMIAGCQAAATATAKTLGLLTAASAQAQLSPPLFAQAGAAAHASVEPHAAEPPFSIVWFSDIQNYSEHYPAVTERMADWIVQNVQSLNATYAVITGDFVNNRDHPSEWRNAEDALSKLKETLPLFTIAGNHDIQDHTYETYLSHFGAARFEGLPSFGGAFEGGRGRYDLLDVGNVHLLLLGMGYRIDDNALEWMNQVLSAYPDRIAILCLHGYMAPDGDYTADGKNVFPDVVAKHRNVKLVLCGHRHGVYHNSVEVDCDGDGAADNAVYQLVADYQDAQMGGSGYLCILTFDPAAEELRVSTYSPYLDDYNLYDDALGLEDFTLPFELHFSAETGIVK